MMKPLRWIWLGVVMMITTIPLWSQDIDFTIRYNSIVNLYEVYGKSDFTQNGFFVGGGSQLSIVLPSSVVDEALIINTIKGGPWTDNSQVYTPAITPNQDYHGIATNGTPMNWETGVETLLFTFSIPTETCIPGIRLYENGIDPPSSEPSMNGSDFKNFFANVLTFTDHYRANYDNVGLTCMPLHESIDTLLTIPEDSSLTVCFPYDKPSINTFSIELCQLPTNGIANANFSGQEEFCLLYEPISNFNGLDTTCITYCDNNNVCDSFTVIINVTPVNDPPIIEDIPLQTLPEDSMITVCTFFSDADVGDSFTESVCGNPVNGTASLSRSGNELCLSYTPNQDYNGLDSVCIAVCDQSGSCDSINIPITITPVDEPIINDPPTIDPIDPIVLPEDSTITVCTDIIDPNTTDTFQGFICEEPDNGVATISISDNTVCLSYTPIPNYNGLDSVCITVCDQSGSCDSINIPIIITPAEEPIINDPPTIDPIDPVSIPEDSTANICTTFEDSDPSDTFQAFLCEQPQNGTAVISVINNLLCLSYTPTPDFHGDDMVCIILCDQAGGCDSIEVPILITPVEELDNNQPPILEPVPPLVTQENEPISYCTPFSDPDENDQFMISICAAPDNGTINLNVVNQELCFEYQPNSGFIGEDIFCLVICDQEGACDSTNVEITTISGATPPPSNDPPDLTPIDPITTLTEESVTVCTPFIDPNIGDTFTAHICDKPVHGSTELTIVDNELCLTYHPEKEYSGRDVLCIAVCDQLGACDEVEITVTIISKNNPPTIESIELDSMPSGETIFACLPFTDPDVGDIFSGRLCNTPINGTASVFIRDRELCMEYIPNTNFIGLEILCVVICDQEGACDSTEVIIMMVSPPNNAPIILDIEAINLPSDSTLNICTAFSDLDVGDTHTVTICNEPIGGNIEAQIMNEEVCLSYQPNDSFEGIDNICVLVCDQDNACDETILSINITPPRIDCEVVFADLNTPDTLAACAGQEVILLVNNASLDFQYEWFHTSDNSSIGTGMELLIEEVSVLDKGTYYVQVSYENCTTNIVNTALSTTVQVIQPTKGIAQTAGYLEACGTSIHLEAIPVEGVEGYWTVLNGSSSVEIQDINDPFAIVDNMQEGMNSFTWTLSTNECTPPSIDTLEIYVYETPEANDDIFSIPLNTPFDLNLIDNDFYTGDSVNTYIISELTNGQVTRNGKGIYTYTPDQNHIGKEDFVYKICNPICLELCAEATVTLTVGENADCFAGGLVTPNDDGYNDTFIVPCLVNYEGSALTIFNRYGDEVYHALDYKNDWEGEYENNPLPAGTYFYILAINDEAGTTINDFLFLQR